MNPTYPTSPSEWREWILLKLGLREEDAYDLLDKGSFPYDRLLSFWEREFSSDHGYNPNFIPALSRNKRGFTLWVYKADREPLWTGADEEQE